MTEDGNGTPEAVPCLRLAADVGGTFTDVVAFDECTGQLRLGKSLSTPKHLVDGVSDALDKAKVDLSEVALFLHGSTLAINTILERSGARTALVTTEGFRDSYEIGRVNRPEAYNLFFRKHSPLIERALRFEVRERLLADGSILTPLDERQLRDIALRLAELGVEAVAVVFLHSYRNCAHELRAKQILSELLPGVFITASHELSQEYREFERTSTTAANAYVGPGLRSYLLEIEDHLSRARFPGLFMLVQSNGGLYESSEAREQCIRMLESGPAAGVIGAQRLCDELGLDRAIAFDMGGTTAKAGVIQDGEARTSGMGMVGRYAEGLPIQVPMLEIHEVGTGGGSLAYVVDGGGLRVGPQSAGAEPGPACYGHGGDRPTVTDANLVLGRLGAKSFLGGEMRLSAAAAEQALGEGVGAPLGVSITEAAAGIVRIATNSMANAVRAVTTARGLDVSGFALVAYGGAGPLHAAAIARELRMKRVIVPHAPGHFSALGMLQADLRRDFVRTWRAPLLDVPFAELERHFREMEADGTKAIRRAPVRLAATHILRSLDMRYAGQEHAVMVSVPAQYFAQEDRRAIKALFDGVHETLYAFSSPGEQAEIVSLRSTVLGELQKPDLPEVGAGSDRSPATALLGTRRVWFAEAGGFAACPIYDRTRLLAGNAIEGPAVVEEHASTTIVPPGDRLEVQTAGHLVISLGAPA